jgi:two-component system CheB/CheR fusion protein
LPISGQTLRQRAEEIAALSLEDMKALSPDEIRRTVHELRVHQIELEMQNEELRRAQAELDASRARYFDLFDLAPVGYCTLSEQGLILEANLTTTTLLGADRKALVKQPITRFIFKEDQDIYYLHRKRLLETGEPQAYELRMVREDGTQFWMLLETVAGQEADGALVHRIVMSEITKRKQSEEKLHQNEEHLKKSQEIAHLGSWELDLIDNRLTWSDEVYRIFGLKPQEFGATYEAFLEATHPDDRAAVDDAYTSSLREGRDVYEIEHRIVKKTNGEIRHVHEKCEHVRDRSGQVIRSIGMIHDITERKRAEEILHQSNAELQTRNEDLDTFGHTVAHDLRNPLGIMIGYADLLADRETPRSDEVAVEMAQIIQRVGLKMDSIIEELMLLAGLRNTAVEMESLDMDDIMTDVLRRLTTEIEQSHAKIVCPPSWPRATGHAPWVEEVWINYVSNAIKYGGNPPHVKLGAVQEGDLSHFWVHDNGSGLTSDKQARLFEPFERLGQTRLKGHGLGLSIVRQIVERMGGQVSVESSGAAGEGSTFSFTLPAG